MRKNHSVVTMLLIFLLLSSSAIGAQQRTPARRKASKSLQESDSTPTPVVHGSKEDGLPDNLKIRGIITELSFAQAYCGIIAWAGTLRIKLLNNVEAYPHSDVFVVVGCFIDPGNENKYLNKTVSLEVRKLYGKKDSPCFFEIATNTIDSKGVPFYCTASGQDRILKIIEEEIGR